MFALAALGLQAQVVKQTTHKGVKNGGYPFWISLPDDYLSHQDSLPVVFFLHGASLCGKNLSRVKTYGTLAAIDMGRNIPAIVVAPQNPGGAWSPKKLDDILEWTKTHYRVDTTRVSVLGMSLGGYGTMDFAGTYPHKIAAAMALCGGCT
ncbi:MAG: phospholipase, partial [Prevotella sp.]|nr:phospholipase [Prevotella sp.]